MAVPAADDHMRIAGEGWRRVSPVYLAALGQFRLEQRRR
jgi:hypothetical protein